MLAKDLMTVRPHSVTPDTSVKTAIQLLLHERISGVPVVDDTGTVCGILTEGDLLRRGIFSIGANLAPRVIDATFFADYIRSHGTTVGDCMTRDVFCVSPDQPLSQLVALIRDRGIKLVPVVAGGKLVGIVSRYDILKAVSMGRDSIAEGDDALQLAVTTRLYFELGLAPDTVDVRVHRGIAELTDPGDDPAKRRAMEIVAESVAGVAGVKFRPA